MKIRYGCHSFINAEPLIYPVCNNLVKHNFEVILDTPYNISRKFNEGSLDIAFIPSVEYFKSKSLLIPNYSISSKGRVDSVLLYSKVDIGKVKTTAVDLSSKTSVSMLNIIFNKKYNIKPRFFPMKPDLNSMLTKCDSALIIGDNALEAKGEGLFVYDLGLEWFELTGNIFVHAVLVVREGITLDSLSLFALKEAKEYGKENIEKIVSKISVKTALNYAECLNYLTNIIKYDLTNQELSGLKLFYDLALDSKLIVDNNKEFLIYDK